MNSSCCAEIFKYENMEENGKMDENMV